MTFAAPRAAAAAYASRWQAATCTVTRADPNAKPVLNPDTGQRSDPPPLTIYTGDCQVLPAGGASVAEFGEAPTPLRQYDVTLTGLADAIHVEDTVTVASTADPQLDGLELRVLDVKKSSLPTNRRLACEEVLD